MGLFESLFGFKCRALIGYSGMPSLVVSKSSVRDLLTPALKRMAMQQGKAFVEPGLSDAFLRAWYADKDGHIFEAIEKSYSRILAKAPTIEEATL